MLLWIPLSNKMHTRQLDMYSHFEKVYHPNLSSHLWVKPGWILAEWASFIYLMRWSLCSDNWPLLICILSQWHHHAWMQAGTGLAYKPTNCFLNFLAIMTGKEYDFDSAGATSPVRIICQFKFWSSTLFGYIIPYLVIVCGQIQPWIQW